MTISAALLGTVRRAISAVSVREVVERLAVASGCLFSSAFDRKSLQL